MDLVAGAKNIIMAIVQTKPKGESKLLPASILPLTEKKYKKIVTELAVFDPATGGFNLPKRHRVLA
jgi:3-oxoacid CoA-transferase subunit B